MAQGRDGGPPPRGGPPQPYNQPYNQPQNRPYQPPDPARLRISDKERHAVAEVLREAAGEGRLDLAELDERLEATYAAKTYADLVPITADLPTPYRPPQPGHHVQPRPPAPAAGPLPTYSGSVAVMAETKRSGVWLAGDTHAAFAFMGSVVIDLRLARFSSPELVINANAFMGSVEVIVNQHTHVLVDGVGVMGSYAEGRSKVPLEAGPQSPVVRLRGVAFMGSVEVKRKAVR
jgi:hypothetical protein